MSFPKPSSSSEPVTSTRSELPPLSAADFHSTNFLYDILGLSPSTFAPPGGNSSASRVVRTLQCGDFKYPDVTSPLNRVLCRNQFSRDESLSDYIGDLFTRSNSSSSGKQGDSVGHSVMSVPDPDLYHFRNGLIDDEGQLMDQIFGIHLKSESPCRQPSSSFTPPSSGFGFSSSQSRDGLNLSKPSERRDLSPQSDIGYGTSFESNDSRGQSVKRDIDIEGLSELIRNVSMNTFSMKIPGSPLCSLSSHRGVHFGKSCHGDNLNILQASGLSHFDPAVAQASLQTIHHHQNFSQKRDQILPQNLDHCINDDTGLLSELSRLDSNLEQPFDDYFAQQPASGNRSFVLKPCSVRPLGFGGSPHQQFDILDLAARNHRSSAGLIFAGGPGRARYAAINSATLTWSGKLPHRGDLFTSQLSCKVFLGGIAWDVTEQALAAQLKTFGNVRVDWPSRSVTATPKGYLYVIFEHETQVRSLLTACTHDFGSGGSWYYSLFSPRKSRTKDIQVIPWVVADSSCMFSTSHQIDPKKTVFVGALHGTMNAEGLCNVFNDLFGGVIFASIDTDKYKYPIGSGRVAFSETKSYMNALAAAFIEIRTPKFTKKIQVDPYLEDALCSSCNLRQGPYFCREFSCFRYFCHTCWELIHSTETSRKHKTLMRNPRPHLSTSRNRPLDSSPGLSSTCLGIQNDFD